MLTEKQINKLIEETKDAYSFDRYGMNGWRKSIINLDKLGYSRLRIKNILRSKFMRWAGDQFASIKLEDDELLVNENKAYVEDWGNFTGKEIVAFHDNFHDKHMYSSRGKLNPQ